MKKVLRRSDDLEKLNNQSIEKKAQQSVDEEILIQMQKKKDENSALKKMIDNLNQLQHLNKTNKKKSKH